MKQSTAAALARIPLRSVPASPAPAPGSAAPARDRPGGSGARDRAVLELLEEDLRVARAALVAVATWVADVEVALSGATSEELRGLAVDGGADAQVDELSTVLWSVRHRLARVAARG